MLGNWLKLAGTGNGGYETSSYRKLFEMPKRRGNRYLRMALKRNAARVKRATLKHHQRRMGQLPRGKHSWGGS